jgi:hypothetical protein
MVIHFEAGVYLKLEWLGRLNGGICGSARHSRIFSKDTDFTACPAPNVEKNGNAPADIMLPLYLCPSI